METNTELLNRIEAHIKGRLAVAESRAASSEIYEGKKIAYTSILGFVRSLRADLAAQAQLTPEILEKIGFSYGYTATEECLDFVYEKGWCYCDENVEVKVTFPHGTDGGEIFVNNYSFRTLRLVFPDKIYLHELQHALKLGGYELEIKEITI